MGCEPIVLQSSEMALPMYEAIGFRTVASHAVLREPLRTIERSYSAAETPTPIGQETPVPPSPQ